MSHKDDALAEATLYAATDYAYAEMMATYAELGELLETNGSLTPSSSADALRAFEDDARALVARLIELDTTVESEAQQRWARWCVQNMTFEGVSDDVVQGRRHAA